MKAAKLLANVLFHLSRLAALLYAAIAFYVGAVLLLFSVTGKGPIAVSDSRFTVYYPFTGKPFFLGEYSLSFIVVSIVSMFIYVLFIWLLSEVFNAFRGERLFTPGNVKRLWRFSMLNLLTPAAGIAFLLVVGELYSSAIMIAMLHLLIGVFAFFMLTIFKQGLELQQEQDLIL